MSEEAPPFPPPGKLTRQLTRGGIDEGEPEDETFRRAAATAAVQAQPHQPSSLGVKVGGITDPGGSKENQDAYFIWHNESQTVIAIGVLDGHGRELGRLASHVGVNRMKDALGDPAMIAAIRKDAQHGFQTLFDLTHAAIRDHFIDYYKRKGFEAKMGEGGFLVVRDRHMSNWVCVHGGTTATVTLLVDGRFLYTANVGDSTALLSGWTAAVLPGNAFDGGVVPRQAPPAAEAASAAADWAPIHLSIDHSPEDAGEFERIRAFRPDPRDPLQPELKFVYDALVPKPKYSCNAVFQRSPAGEPTVTNNGQYYKNVRSEWASLVTTPVESRYQDALAFTRSIGDFHLQTYGVLCKPDVRCVDLDVAVGRDRQPACVIVASDGVWDNWTYEDTTRKLREYVEEARTAPDASGPAVKFMELNYQRAKRNFGKHADNMTAVLMYLFPKSS